MLFKTVLAPNAPWPKPEEIKIVKRKTTRKRPTPRIKLALPGDGLDYFAEAREQIASGKAKRNPNYDRKQTKAS